MAGIIIKWVVVLLAVMNFGFMAFDGTRALVKGDYIRPSSGAYAGQLGPWSKLVARVGIDPESNAMKTIFLLWGIIGLTITVCFILNRTWAPTGMIIINILSLWYLVPGTISSVLQVVLLLVLRSVR